MSRKFAVYSYTLMVNSQEAVDTAELGRFVSESTFWPFGMLSGNG